MFAYVSTRLSDPNALICSHVPPNIPVIFGIHRDVTDLFYERICSAPFSNSFNLSNLFEVASASAFRQNMLLYCIAKAMSKRRILF